MVNNEFSQRLQEFRKREGFSQAKLAELVGVSFMTVRRWECGEVIPRLDEIRRLSEVLHKTFDELLNGSDDEKIKITLVYDWNKMKEGNINMNGNDFELILGSQGQIGLKGSGKFTCREDITSFLSRIEEQLEVAFSAQLQRGAIQEA